MKTRIAANEEGVPAKYLRTLLRVPEAQGYDVRELLETLALPFDPFALDPEQTVAASHYTLIYTRVMWLLQDESFGLNLRQRTPAGTFRMMCLCIIHCGTLEQALHRAAEFTAFCRDLTGLPRVTTRPVRRLGDGSALYIFPSAETLGVESGETAIPTLIHCMLIWRRFCGWLIGRSLELHAVSLQCQRPRDSDWFEQLLGCPVNYAAERNAFVFAEHYLDCPLVHTEESLREFLANAPYRLLVSGEEEDASLLAQMKRLVGNDLSRDFPSVVDMAARLNMSVRTLRRRLKEHGTTYQQFKDTLRKEHAIRWLGQPELKINAVSALLGFDEPSAFHRSFKKWTGMTPGEFRNSRQITPPHR